VKYPEEIYHDRVKVLEAEVERLRAALAKAQTPTWFYPADDGERCYFDPLEIIDDVFYLSPGQHVIEIDCATSLPSIWCAVTISDDEDADERCTYTEHATEAEARAALAGKAEQ
jgi:hypothetical protein